MEVQMSEFKQCCINGNLDAARLAAGTKNDALEVLKDVGFNGHFHILQWIIWKYHISMWELKNSGVLVSIPRYGRFDVLWWIFKQRSNTFFERRSDYLTFLRNYNDEPRIMYKILKNVHFTDEEKRLCGVPEDMLTIRPSDAKINHKI